jgi:hypothetical protein
VQWQAGERRCRGGGAGLRGGARLLSRAPACCLPCLCRAQDNDPFAHKFQRRQYRQPTYIADIEGSAPAAPKQCAEAQQRRVLGIKAHGQARQQAKAEYEQAAAAVQVGACRTGRARRPRFGSCPIRRVLPELHRLLPCPAGEPGAGAGAVAGAEGRRPGAERQDAARRVRGSSASRAARPAPRAGACRRESLLRRTGPP